MKKLFVLIFGLFMMASSHACNMDVQNCIDFFTPDIVKYNGELKNNAVFMGDAAAVTAWQERTQAFKQKVDLCSTQKCVNQKFLDYHNYVVGLVNKYRPLAQKQQPSAKVVSTTSAASNDKWFGQCVVTTKNVVIAYVDQSATTKVVGFDPDKAYTVSQANGGNYVGLVTVSDYTKPDPDASAGKFAGWVKKSDLEMLALRNCN